jgi:hypothetical protein
MRISAAPNVETSRHVVKLKANMQKNLFFIYAYVLEKERLSHVAKTDHVTSSCIS